MSEATVECPVTPERIDQCPATPEERERSQTPSSTAENSDRNGAGSPPPNCAICLGRCVNKCFTDNCVHNFCFNCLLEWSRIKAECPLCKQPFKSIIYNVRSPELYEEYIVRQPTPINPSIYHRLNVLLSDRPRFRYRATLQVRQHESDAIQQLLLQQAAHDHVYFNRFSTPRGRRHVYEQGYFAHNLSDFNGRIRECSATFYRENPAQVHRLMPWISREINALTNNVAHRSEFIITVIHNLLTEHDITSQEFFNVVEPLLLDKTRHFIHELTVFARSPYDIFGYDRHVYYPNSEADPFYSTFGVLPPVQQGPISISTEESSDEDDDVRIVTRPGTTEFTFETRSNVSTVIVMGRLSNQPSSSEENNEGATAGQSRQPPEVINELSSGSNGSEGTSQMLENNLPVPHSNHIIESLLTDSDPDECVFVREQKPPHLRTPELVVLNSDDEDSDVVIVDNEITIPSNSSPVVSYSSRPDLSDVPPKKRIKLDSQLNENGFGVKVENLQQPSTSTAALTVNEIPSTSANKTRRRKFYDHPSLKRDNVATGKSLRGKDKGARIYSSSSSSTCSTSVEEHSDSSDDNHPLKDLILCPKVARKRRSHSSSTSSSSSSSSSDSSETSSSSNSSSSSSSSSHEEYKLHSKSTAALRKRKSRKRRRVAATAHLGLESKKKFRKFKNSRRSTKNRSTKKNTKSTKACEADKKNDDDGEKDVRGESERSRIPRTKPKSARRQKSSNRRWSTDVDETTIDTVAAAQQTTESSEIAKTPALQSVVTMPSSSSSSSSARNKVKHEPKQLTNYSDSSTECNNDDDDDNTVDY